MWKILLVTILLVVAKSSKVHSMTTHAPEITTTVSESIETENSESSCDENSTEGNNLCNKMHNHPTEAQLNLKSETLQNETNFRFDEFFGDIDVSVQESTHIEDEPQFLCRSIRKIIYPKIGLLKDGKNAMVVNTDQKRQPVYVEICSKENAPCDPFDAIPFQYKVGCTQVYSYYPLVALSEDGTYFREYFKMPSACKCSLSLKTD